MSKFSYKSLFIIFFFLLIGVVVLSRFVLPNKKVSASWWNESWSYRKAISLTNSTGSNQTNTQVKIFTNYDLSSLVTAGKIQSDLDDLRFTDINGNLIKYWIEDSTNNSVDIWGFIPSSLTSDTSIYMYYGNSSVNAGKTITGGIDTPGISCYAIKLSGASTNGSYYIDPTGQETSDKFPIYCDMTADGGGWTLMMKANGSSTTFNYDANYWTTNNTLNPENTDITNSTEAKYNSFNILSINEIRATWPQTDHTMLNTVSPTTPLTLFQTTVDLGPTMTQFDYTNFPYQTGYQSYGFNLTCASAKSVRWGWMFNNETTCSSNDVTSGIGLKTSYSTTHGGWVGCCATNKANGGYPFNVLIWGRESTVAIPANITFSVPSTEELSPAPIAYWKFDEGIGSTANDSSSNNNNGIITGAIWQNEDQCISGKCLSFNGSTNYFDSEKIFSFTDITFSSWIKIPSSFPIGSRVGNIIGNFPSSTVINFEVHTSGRLRAYWNGQVDLFGTSDLRDDEWHYVVFTRNKTTNKITLYIDSKFEAESTAGSDLTIIKPFRIGGDYRNGDSPAIPGIPFTGLIDEVKIYPYARTADQIKLDYNSRGSSKGSSVNLGIKSSTAPLTTPYLYYSFDDAVGGIGCTLNNKGSSRTSYPYGFLKSGLYETADVGTSSNMVKETNSTQGNYNTNYYNNWILKALSGSAIGQSAVITKYLHNSYTDKEFQLQSSLTSISSGDQYHVYYNDEQVPQVKTNECKIGKCLYFDGYDDYVKLSTFNPNSVAQNFTISFWINPQNTGGAIHNQNGPIMFGISGGKLYVNLYINSSWNNWSTNSSINQNQWTHVAISYDQINTKIYINGIGTTQKAQTGIINGGSNVFLGVSTGGGEFTGASSYFKGYLDEYKIFASALTPDEIKQDYNQGAAVQFGTTNQTIGGTTTSLEYCIPGDTSYCAPPVAEWKMDEKTGTTIKDTSGNNNTGTFGAGNSAPTWTTGKIGAGLNFNATNNNYVSGPLDGTGLTDFSYNFWFKTNTISGTAGILQWATTLSSGSPMVYVNRSGANINIYNSGTYSPSIPIYPNVWYHFSSAYSAGTTTTTIYIDGVSKITFGRQLTYYNYGTTLYLGNGYNGFFDGKIDHVKIYNYDRTPAQIAYDYNKGEPIGWWKFDECQGNIAKDASGLGNTGTIIIGASGSQNSLGTCQVGTSAAWTNGSTGKINYSLNFDGTDDYIDMGDIDLIKDNDFSISFWGKINNFTYYTGVGKGVYTDGQKQYQVGFGTNGVPWVVLNNGTNKGVLSFGNALNTNNWYHLTYVFDRDNLCKVYVNGNLWGQSSLANYQGDLSNDYSLLIGKYQSINTYTDGQMDDIRIYNYALTSEQVKTVYNNGAVNFQ